MILYFVYLLVFIIFIFLIYTSFKAVSRGMKAKDNNETSHENYASNSNIVYELEKLRKLYEEGVLNKEEFDKAKDKLINS